MKKAAAFLLSFSMLVALSGCSGKMYSDVREIDQLELIQTVGIDVDERGLVSVTAATGTGLSGDPCIILNNESVTMARALQEMQNYSSKKYIFYGHTTNLVIGEYAAEKGMSAYLDYIARAVEFRMDTRLFIVKDGTAKDLIVNSSSEKESVTELLASLEKDVRLISESYAFGCGDVTERLLESGSAVVAAIMLIGDNGIIRGNEGSDIASAGYAVVVNDKLYGFIDSENSRGVNILINQVGGDIVEIPDQMGEYVALRVTGSKCGYDAKFENGSLKTIYIDASIEANLTSSGKGVDIYDPESIKYLEYGLASLEAGRMENVLKLSKKSGADFLALNEKIRMKHPVLYEKIRDVWTEQLERAEIVISVSASIERTYDIGNAYLSEGEGGNGRTG